MITVLNYQTIVPSPRQITPKHSQTIPSLLQKQSTPSPRFGRQESSYDGVYLLTDFNDETSNTEALTRFRDVLKFVSTKGHQIKDFQWAKSNVDGLFSTVTSFLRKGFQTLTGIAPKLPHTIEVKSSSDIPFGNVDYAALSLQRLAGARLNKNIFVHVIDPGVGNGNSKQVSTTHDRSVLITENHGVMVGPNNGSLSLLIQSLKNKGEPFELYPIDLEKVQKFEQIRLNNPQYQLPETFHGRDVFAVVAAAIAGGLDPKALCKTDTNNAVAPKISPFFQQNASLPESAGEEALFQGIQDRTFGNIKTNLVLSPQNFSRLLEKKAIFEISEVGTHNQTSNPPIQAPVQKFFSQVPKGQPLVYLGSSYGPHADARFLEIAINLGHASQQLNIHPSQAKQLRIKRIR